MSGFTVTIENFEGPIDALLQMIEKRKLPVNDISLADITDDYIRFVASLDDESLSNKTHFIYIASTLTLIKSKSILPILELTHEEEDDIESLKKRILIFQEYQKVGQYLKEAMSATPYFFYGKTRKKSISFTPHSDITGTNLRDSLLSVFNQLPEKKPTKKEASVRIAVHIEEMMDSLTERLEKAIKTDFHSFIGSHTNGRKETREVKVYKVVGFLAMLELVKNGALSVLQKKNFSNIEIENL